MSGNLLTVLPASPLSPGATYTVVVSVEDMPTVSFNFTAANLGESKPQKSAPGAIVANEVCPVCGRQWNPGRQSQKCPHPKLPGK